MTKACLVGFAGHPWDEPEWMSRQQILSRLAKRGWPTIYSQGTLDWWHRDTDNWNQYPLFNRFRTHSGVELIQPGRIFPRWQKSDFLTRQSLKLHCRAIRKSRACAHKSIIAILFNPAFYPYLRFLKPDKVFYHAHDDFSGYDNWNRELQDLQEKLVREADVVSAITPSVAAKLGRKDVAMLPSGADTTAFNQAIGVDAPTDLSIIPHPRIGYCGAINKKVDLNLVAQLASAKPEWNWVFVGRLESDALENDAALKEGFERCKTQSNVHFLGQKARTDIPAYVANMDVNAMFYRTDENGWWKSIYPLKLHEYLATGLPVISSPIDSVLHFKDVVTIANPIQEWITGIGKALSEPANGLAKKRIITAQMNSWDSRVDTLEEWLRTHAEKIPDDQP